MKYVSIDLETTGLDPNTCQILEFGAVIDDMEKPEIAIEVLPKLQLRIAWKYIKGEIYALNMNKEIIQKILHNALDKPDYPDANYVDPNNLGEIFNSFITENGIEKVIAAGKNFAGFDLPFLKAHPNFVTSGPKFHHRCLDPGMFFLQINDKVPPDMKVCKERAGIAGEVAHTAIEDAIDVIKLIRKGLAK